MEKKSNSGDNVREESAEVDDKHELYDGMISNQSKIIANQNDLLDLIELIYKTLGWIIFFLTITMWKVFLWEPFNSLIDHLIRGWTHLTENYKILVLGIIGTLIAGIIATIIGGLLLNKIRSSFNKVDSSTYKG